ncbi:MAG: exonuclease subunit SbcD [Chamaesiphon sp.]|nr:exonuclease subunit SbcD [Chamaesiphon sp.]
MKILHLSDIHMGGGFAHGKIDPETGFNTRFQDFVKSLSRSIDRAISEPVDLVLFGGDAFPDATPAPYIQQAFAREFYRLVAANIPLVLLVGNHDRHAQGQGGASLSIYRSLGVPGTIVGDTIDTYTITTPSGDIQIITLPWIDRSTLLTREISASLSILEVNQLLLDKLQPRIEGEIRKLNPALPTIVLAHLMADNATLGAEKLLAVGRGFTIPLSFLTRDCFDYVALGHVHRHQNLNKTNDPAVVYPGSIERVDFSEEKEDKGFVMVTIEPTEQTEEQPASKNFETTWEFCPLPVREFRTIKIDVSESEQPQVDIEKAIAKVEIADVVVRLIYQLSPDRVELVNTAALHEALSAAHHYTIQAELISQLSRPRLPELGCSVGDPMVALSTYLENRPDLESIAKAMIAAANELMAGDRLSADLAADLVLLDIESSTDLEIDRSSPKDADAQLTLL